MPQATSFALASRLIHDATSVASKVDKAERQLKLQEILNGLRDDDREILAMRHFEQLTNLEAALILEIGESTAAMRHARALQRLKRELRRASNIFGDDFSFAAEVSRLPPNRERRGNEDGRLMNDSSDEVPAEILPLIEEFMQATSARGNSLGRGVLSAVSPIRRHDSGFISRFGNHG